MRYVAQSFRSSSSEDIIVGNVEVLFATDARNLRIMSVVTKTQRSEFVVYVMPQTERRKSLYKMPKRIW